MKTEVRTRIVEIEDAIDAAFDLFESVVNDPSAENDLRGASVRPVERIERASEGKAHEIHVAFEVTYGTDHKTALPGPHRVLLGLGR